MANAGFPSHKDLVRATWVPIQIEPMPGSGERLTIAVAVVAADGKSEVIAADRLDALACLFPSAHTRLRFFVDAAIDAVRELASQGNLQEANLPIEGLFIGPSRDALGQNLEQIGRTWLKKTSSLVFHEAGLAVQALDAPPKRIRQRSSGDHLPVDVFQGVVNRSPLLTNFFRKEIQDGKTRIYRKRSDGIVIDFDGEKLVANFSTLRAENAAQAYQSLKPRLWDIDVHRERRGAAASALSFELLIQSPSLNDPRFTSDQLKRVEDAMAKLEDQADKKQIRLEAFQNSMQIAERVLAMEAAA